MSGKNERLAVWKNKAEKQKKKDENLAPDRGWNFKRISNIEEDSDNDRFPIIISDRCKHFFCLLQLARSENEF